MGRRLTHQEQAHHLRARYPGGHCVVSGRSLRWHGDVRPLPLSRRYRLRVLYDVTPDVWVVHPPLEKRGDEHAPHLYEKPNKLCLYLPRSGEWDNTQILALTIVPWASEWLAHYEHWLVNGEWHGGGEHP